MKVRGFIIPLLSLIVLSSCGEPKIPTKTYSAEVWTWSPYAVSDPLKTNFLWGNDLFPDFVTSKIDVSKLVPGDAITAEYTGSWSEFQTYPGDIEIRDGECVKAYATLGEVREVTVTNGHINAWEGIKLDYMANRVCAIDKEKNLIPLKEVEHGYLVISALEKTHARILLTYNPRE